MKNCWMKIKKKKILAEKILTKKEKDMLYIKNDTIAEKVTSVLNIVQLTKNLIISSLWIGFETITN